MAERTCFVEGCDKPAKHRRLMCSMHVSRMERTGGYGPPRLMKERGQLSERVWRYVNKAGPVPDYAPHLGPCWLWTGPLDRHGYGGIARGGRGQGKVGAHRATYETVVGPIPEGLELDHLCRVPACVNPSHLEPVTRSENTRRGILFATLAAKAAARTHCKYGHELTPENTRIRPSDGVRVCRTCSLRHSREGRRRKRREA